MLVIKFLKILIIIFTMLIIKFLYIPTTIFTIFIIEFCQFPQWFSPLWPQINLYIITAMFTILIPVSVLKTMPGASLNVAELSASSDAENPLMSSLPKDASPDLFTSRNVEDENMENDGDYLATAKMNFLLRRVKWKVSLKRNIPNPSCQPSTECLRWWKESHKPQ